MFGHIKPGPGEEADKVDGQAGHDGNHHGKIYDR